MKKPLFLAFNLFVVILLAFALYLNFVKEENNPTPIAPSQKQVASSADNKG